MIGICPNCNQRYSYNKYDIDYVHQCNSQSEAIDKESVLIVGDYVDEITNEVVARPNANLQGTVNKLNFTRAGLDGRTLGDFNVRGERSDNKRDRQKYEHISLR